jgi:hypothetical protein
VYVLLWLALTGYTILESLSARTFGADSAHIPTRYLWIAVAVTTPFVIVTLLKRSVLVLNVSGISVSWLPWHLPRDVVVPMQDLRGVDIDTKISTSTDENGIETDSYEFGVEINRRSAKSLVISCSSDEYRAQYLRRFLQARIEEYRER